MSAFVPPAGLGSVIPSSPAQGVVIGSTDQMVLDYIIGKTIIGGSQFADVLGRFFPVTINNTGITINSAGTNSSAIVFHNTASVGTDELITLGTTNALTAVPNSASSVNNAFLVADRTGASYLAWVLYPAQLSGGTTQPEIDAVSPAGTGNTVYRFGANYVQIVGAATTITPTIFLLGVDGNIGLNIVTKGTAGLQIGPTTGNMLLLSPGASGSPVVVNAVGVDGSIDVRVLPKGAGLMDYAIGSTALGGGAGATLGTIGGTGPTVAGQAYWIALKISGTKVWFPVWI